VKQNRVESLDDHRYELKRKLGSPGCHLKQSRSYGPPQQKIRSKTHSKNRASLPRSVGTSDLTVPASHTWLIIFVSSTRCTIKLGL